MLVVALIPIIGGILVGIGGYLGWSGRLRRDGGKGIRTEATMHSDEAFAMGNKVAGIPTMAAGAVGVFGGAAAFAMPTVGGVVTAAALGVIGLLALLAAGGILGNRAAGAVPAPEVAGGCGGCACGGCGA